MKVWSQLRFLQNIKVPWQVRMGMDLTIIFGPLYFLSYYNFTLYEFTKDSDRYMRRRMFDGVHLKEETGDMSQKEVVDYYQSLGFENPV
jgi:hypothetical protein